MSVSSDESVSSVESNKIEKPKRKPMSDEAKKAFAERMRIARSKKTVSTKPKIAKEAFEEFEEVEEDPPKKTTKKKKETVPKETKSTIVNNYYNYDKTRKPREKKVLSVETVKPKLPTMTFA